MQPPDAVPAAPRAWTLGRCPRRVNSSRTSDAGPLQQLGRVLSLLAHPVTTGRLIGQMVVQPHQGVRSHPEVGLIAKETALRRRGAGLPSA
jgi:hypothetical protein